MPRSVIVYAGIFGLAVILSSCSIGGVVGVAFVTGVWLAVDFGGAVDDEVDLEEDTS